ncbi:MAG: hypothetical protein [Caudoviricetes sp.]|nr:MAG: hypothetical protein [Caudoviricetes sp.]
MMHVNVGGEFRNPIGSIANLDMTICVGFGTAQIEKDDVVFFNGEQSDKIKTLAEFEAIAKKSPESKWICRMDAPLWNAIWERGKNGEWTCIKNGMGFA